MKKEFLYRVKAEYQNGTSGYLKNSNGGNTWKKKSFAIKKMKRSKRVDMTLFLEEYEVLFVKMEPFDDIENAEFNVKSLIDGYRTEIFNLRREKSKIFEQFSMENGFPLKMAHNLVEVLESTTKYRTEEAYSKVSVIEKTIKDIEEIIKKLK